MRKIISLMVLFVVGLLTLPLVSALNETNLQWGSVKVNGDEVSASEVLTVEEGQTLKIRVGLVAGSGAEDIEVNAKIGGYEYSDYEDLSDSTALFDLAAGTTKYVNLEVRLPPQLEKEVYWLRLRVLDKNTPDLEKDIRLNVEPTRHGISIKDVSFSPGSTVKAGRSLLTTVLLENYGDKDEDEVKVTVSIPALGVSATDFVDVEMKDHNVKKKVVDEMFLPVPASAREGDYEVVVTAKYRDLRESTSETFTIHVAADERSQEPEAALVLAVGPESQNVEVGKTATFAVALSNAGSASKAYLLEASAGDWATVSLSESLVVLESGKSQVVYIEITPVQGATFGEHIASVRVKSGREVLETIALKANVVARSGTAATQTSFSLRSGLEIALIVLVVILIIVGLIFGFSRMKKDEEEGEGKTYY